MSHPAGAPAFVRTNVSSLAGFRRAATILLAVAALASIPAGGSLPAVAAPSLQTFVAVADAYVQSNRATTNHGTTSKLNIDASPIARSYLRFDVGGLSGSVTRATLRLTGGTGSTVGFTVRDVANDSWGETTITFANAAAFSAAAVGSSGPYATGQSVSIDITPLVTGDGPVSVVLTTTTSTAMSVSAREASAASRPQLVVETAAGAPANSSLPTIAGTPDEGRTLTADPGTWTGSQPLEFSYRWQRCSETGASCVESMGATAQTYTLGVADVGSTIRVAVTASNEAGSDTAVSSPTAVVTASTPPESTAPPTISGIPQEQRTLTAEPGTWAGSDPISYAYQWQRCGAAGESCAEITGATVQTYTLGAADVASTIRVAVTASNDVGSATSVSAKTAVVAARAQGDPVVMAAGDIACASAVPSSSSCHQGATSDLLVNGAPDAVLPLGDLQYEDGELAGFQSFYDPTWGRMKSVTYPVPGNHEYHVVGAPGYYEYFGDGATPLDPACRVNCRGYYSFDLGDWHLIALNSNCSAVGGCGAGSPQEQWLRQDLAASGASCTIAYWHHPLYTSGRYAPGISSVRPLYQALYEAGADVVLSGHDHNYERFARQNPNGVGDPRGIRQFVVGTGGKSHYAQSAPIANSEALQSTVYGVLKLTLHPGTYDWEFVPEAGATFADSGSDTCGAAGIDTEPPSAPAGFTATPASSTQVDLSWTAATDNVGVTSYQIHRNGALLATTASAATTYSDTTATGGTLYSYEVRARDVAGNVSAPSNSVAVATPTGSSRSTFSPQADARVSEASPTTNYGTSYLRADGGSDPDVESYLRFSVSGISGTVQAATLRIYGYSGTANGPAVFTSTAGWTESALTWSNRPPRSGAGVADKGSISANSWIEFDVTALVGGNGTYDFVLATSSSDGIDMYAREVSTLRPELVVLSG